MPAPRPAGDGLASEIAGPGLAAAGAARIGEGFAVGQPLRGLTIAACLHLTAETAVLVNCAGGWRCPGQGAAVQPTEPGCWRAMPSRPLRRWRAAGKAAEAGRLLTGAQSARETTGYPVPVLVRAGGPRPAPRIHGASRGAGERRGPGRGHPRLEDRDDPGLARGIPDHRPARSVPRRLGRRGAMHLGECLFSAV